MSHRQGQAFGLGMAFLTVIVFSTPLLAQVPSFASPEELVDRLSKSDLSTRTSLAKEMRLDSCGAPDHEAHETTVLRPRLDDLRETAVVRLDCLMPENLLVLVRSRDNRWHWLDTVALINRYDRMSIEFRTVVQAPVQELVVHNQGTAGGTGLFLGHLLVFKLLDDRMRLVFTSREWAFESLTWGRRGDYEEKTQFSFKSGDHEHAASITATISDVNPSPETLARFKVVREYGWDEQLRTFLPNLVDSISVLPNPGAQPVK